MFKPVFQAVQMFLKGATGKDRQDKHYLSEHLLALQVAYDQLQQKHDTLHTKNNRLQQERDRLDRSCDRLQTSQKELTQRLQYSEVELEEYVNITDIDTKSLELENQELQTRLRQSEDDKETLQNTNGVLRGEIALLKHQLDLLSYQTTGYQTTDSSQLGSSAEEPSLIANDAESVLNFTNDFQFGQIDLSNISLALIGGHETTYRKVTEELEHYGLKTCIHVPPRSIASNGRNKIKDKISNCDLIITVTSHVDHSVSECVKQLKDAQVLAGECIRVSCHGKSGLVREVLKYFSDLLHTSEMA